MQNAKKRFQDRKVKKAMKGLFLTLMMTSSLGLLGANEAFSASQSWAPKQTWPSSESGERAANTSRRTSPGGRHSEISPFAPDSHNLALDVGQVFLMGDLSDRYASNLGWQLHYTYGVSDMFGFDSSLGRSSHSDGQFSMTTLLTGLRANLSWFDKVVPYAVFGLGFYKPSYDISPTASVSPVLFGIHMGPGIDLLLTDQFFFGASLTFHDMFGANTLTPEGKPIDVGGSYTSFLLHAGTTF